MISICQPDHRMLRGLRFFAIANNVVEIPTLTVPGGRGVCAGGPTLGVLSPWSCIQGDGTDNIVTFGNFNNYFNPDARDITVIGRFKSNAAQVKIVAAARNSASPTAGWQILYANTGGSETGFNFTVWSAAGKFMEAQDGLGDATVRNKNVVFAGVYENRTKEVYAYIRTEGDSVARIRNSAHTNTNSANTALEDWEVRAGAFPLYWLAASAGSLHFNGDVAWLAVFDRVLNNEEIAEWSRDEEWPFLDDYPLVTSFTARTFRTTVGVAGSAGFSQAGVAREFDTPINAEAIMTGTLTNVGSGSITRTFRTEVGVVQHQYFGIPLLKRFRTTVGVDYTLTPAMVRTFRTRVGVRVSGNLLLDGRRDLLYTGGYRR